MMTLTELITILLAVYGSVLSTVLLIKEINKEKKKLRILIIQNTLFQQLELLIKNVGVPKIVIRDYSLIIDDEVFPRGDVFKWNNTEGFPISIKSGESISLIFSDYVFSYFPINLSKFSLALFDEEGESFAKFEVIEHDNKWGFFRKIHKER